MHSYIKHWYYFIAPAYFSTALHMYMYYKQNLASENKFNKRVYLMLKSDTELCICFYLHFFKVFKV